MPAPVFHLGATVLCSHSGIAQPQAPYTRVLVTGQPVVVATSPYSIAGCTLSAASLPPCVIGQFVVGATRVLCGGLPLVNQTSSSTCIPTGTPLLPILAQTRVFAT